MVKEEDDGFSLKVSRDADELFLSIVPGDWAGDAGNGAEPTALGC